MEYPSQFVKDRNSVWTSGITVRTVYAINNIHD